VSEREIRHSFPSPVWFVLCKAGGFLINDITHILSLALFFFHVLTTNMASFIINQPIYHLPTLKTLPIIII
jgi:hypothetical protein